MVIVTGWVPGPAAPSMPEDSITLTPAQAGRQSALPHAMRSMTQ